MKITVISKRVGYQNISDYLRVMTHEVCRARFSLTSLALALRTSHACVADAGDNENLSESLWEQGSCELRKCEC